MSQPVTPADIQRWQHLTEEWATHHPVHVLRCSQCGTQLNEANLLHACGMCNAFLCTACHCPCAHRASQQ
jgi:hypothetical protein